MRILCKKQMKAAVVIAMAGIMAQFGFSQSARSEARTRDSDREKLIGAWHLVSIEQLGPDGKLIHLTNLKGMLIYTREGHISVQIMYPASEATVSNDYVLNGYEASFGSYDVDEAARTLTHHVQASITHGLVGKDLTRAYRFSNGCLIIKSTRSDEHWSVMWEHD